MDTTKVFRNGGSLAVRLPKKYAIPVGDVGIAERDGVIILRPLDDRGWPEDLATRFSALSDLEKPVRRKDSRALEF
jgi:virulence-associated protein VagC